MHAMGSGARKPSGEDRGQIGIMLPKAVQHRASGNVLKRCLKVQRDQNTGMVRLRKALYGFNHLVGSVLATHAVLEWAGCCNNGEALGCNDGFERKSPWKGHHEEGSVSSRRLGEWRDLTSMQVL